jgi:predicted nucleic-acid-binding protein
MTRIDANVILRYLLGDHPEHAARAAEVIDRSSVFVAVEVLCEVVYVLGGAYSVERKTIAEKLAEFIRLDNVAVDDARVLMAAFDLFAQTKIDFVDSLLCAYRKVRGDTVVTFDQKLMKLMDVG